MEKRMSEDEIKERIACLDKEIAEYPYWGAALGAMDEERRELKRSLRAIELAKTNT